MAVDSLCGLDRFFRFWGINMSSSGSSGGSTTTTQELPSWAQPAAQQLLSQGEALSQAPVPQYTGQTVAGINGTQSGGIAGVTGAATNAQGIASQAQGYTAGLQANPNGFQTSNPYTGNVTASTAATQFADPNGNPALASQIDAGNTAITNQYSNVTAPTTLAQFRNAGAFGGSAQDQATGQQEYQLGQALASNTSNLENNAYNTAAGVAQTNAAQTNAVNLANQSVGTNANATENTLNSNNYNTQQGNILTGLGTTLNANNSAGTLAGQQITAGGVTQQNSQDELNAAYQQFLNQVNAPYQQESTLSSALSGALGSGAGTSISSSTAGTGNTLASALGLGTAGLGVANSASKSG